MRLYTVKSQIQKQVFSASLEKSIGLLLLPHTELALNIEQELQNNPLLEAEFENPPVDGPREEEPQIDKERMNALMDLPSSNIPKLMAEEETDLESPSMANMMSLEDHLFHQLFWEISDPVKRKIGNYIIGNLDKDGFLHLGCEEIALALNIPGPTAIKEVLNTIQNLDPPGIATKDFKECLIVQLQSRQSPHRDLAIRIVEEYLDHLANKRYASLSKKLSVTIEEIHGATELIVSLEPKPARNYRPLDPSIYIEPDLFIRKDEEGQYIIETNKSGLPTLRISRLYRDLLNEPNTSKEDRLFIKDKINNAINFIKNIHRRGETLKAIAGYILTRQKDFFDGEESALTPLTLKDVALHLDRNESTISRAISNKYIDTPQGLFPLKFFFSNNVSQQNHGNISAHTVKQELAQLIAEENKESPLSDQDIQDYFNTKGMRLARRTITKYRQALHIPSSHLRK